MFLVLLILSLRYRKLRTTVLRLACSVEHAECLREAGELFKNWIQDPKDVRPHPDIRDLVYYYGDWTIHLRFAKGYSRTSFVQNQESYDKSPLIPPPPPLLVIFHSYNRNSGWSKWSSTLRLKLKWINTSIVAVSGMHHAGDEAMWRIMLKKFTAEADSTEKLKLMQGLAAIRSTWILNMYVAQFLEIERII